MSRNYLVFNRVKSDQYLNLLFFQSKSVKLQVKRPSNQSIGQVHILN